MNIKNRLLKTAGVMALLASFASCKDETIKYRIIYSAEEPIGQISKKLKAVVDRTKNMEAELIIGHGSIANVDSILNGSADLTIIENHTPVDSGITSILPFYPQILHILYKSEAEITDFRKLVEGKKVFIGVEGSGTYRFMMDLFKFFEVDITQVEITDNPFDHEVYCAFGDLIHNDNLVGLEDFSLFSFDEVSQQGKGSIADAICLKYPQLKTFIIPKNTYGQLTLNPVLTIAVDAVLVARSDLSSESIYQLTKALFQSHLEFNAISPLIYLNFTESFDYNKLNFPFHNGARMYLEKDQPGFFERYAEIIGVIFSLILALIYGVISFSKWRNQNKKDRIDVFYKRVIDIKNGIPRIRSSREAKLKILELRRQENKAFGLLIDEKLGANESFRIYMDLNKETLQALLVRARAFHKGLAIPS